MGGETHEVEVERVECQWQASYCLHRVAMNQGAMTARDGHHRRDRLDNPGLIVRRHDRDQRRTPTAR